MFDKHQAILVHPIFYSKTEDSARKLAQYLETEMKYRASITPPDSEKAPWVVRCKAHIRRDLDAQKHLERKLLETAERFESEFQGWKHTLLTQTLH